MRSLTAPTADADALYRACADATRNAELKERLLAYIPRVTAAAVSYREAGATLTFHALPAPAVATEADQELRDLYPRTMARKGRPGRATYDVLRMGAKSGICPLCVQRPVATLDHYLPKESYPDLAILPINLVPACHSCNFDKGRFVPENATDQLLHPYFDRLPQGVWLHADVSYHSDIPVLAFDAKPPAAWNRDLAARVVGHFERLGLSRLYSIQGTAEIPMIRLRLARLLERGGAGAVRDHLQEEASTRDAENPNSWQTATYRALAAEQRFCNGGFGP